MNPRLEWAVPIVVGLVFGLGLWAVADSGGGEGDGGAQVDGGSSSGTSTSAAPPDVVLPFAEGRALDKHDLTFLVLAPRGKARATAELNESGPAFAASLTWQGQHVALYTTQVNACPPPRDGMMVACDPPWAFGPWPLPKTSGLQADARPVLLHDGYNATKVTAFVFNETGLLLASNGNASEVARFEKHGDYLRLPTSAWYLGDNATAPNGTSRLPPFAQDLIDGGPHPLRDEIDNLPVGGVASVRSNAYATWFGTLFVTIRVDELVYAP